MDTMIIQSLTGGNMANGRQAVARKSKMAERARHQQESLFPGYPLEWLWHRKTNDGYCSLPRTLPIAMQIIDSVSKGQPAGHTLFCLWARSPDQPLISIESPATFAAEAGFQGERAVDTWRRRMKTLKEHAFIDARKGPSGDFHYVLLLNPNVAVERMKSWNQVQDTLYTRFVDRLLDIGAYGDIEAIRQYWAEVQMASAPVKVPPPPEAIEKDLT